MDWFDSLTSSSGARKTDRTGAGQASWVAPESLPGLQQLLRSRIERSSRTKSGCAVFRFRPKLPKDEFATSNKIEPAHGTLTRDCKRGCALCQLLQEVLPDTSSSSPYLTWIQLLYSIRHGISLQGADSVSPFYLSVISSTLETSASRSSIPLAMAHPLPMVLCPLYVVEITRRWIQECKANHSYCQPPLSPTLPTRILDVGYDNSEDDIKLVLRKGSCAQYIALSYCWGASSALIKTTRETELLWAQGIPWVSLPLIFRDAVLLTRAFGIRYLWIDALCILQDDLGDWEAESANMARIYSDSFLTIAATAASDPSEGLFSPRWTDSVLERTTHKSTAPTKNSGLYIRPQLHLAHDRFTEVGNVGNHLEDAPLLSRAWAFQERLLPTRTLHFHAEELVWECKAGVSCECRELHDKFISPNQSGSRIGTGWLKKSLASTVDPIVSAQVLGNLWLNVVSAYTQLRLTRETDRLAALWGIASRLEHVALGDYHAGIWQHDFARGLVFERVRTPFFGTASDIPEPESTCSVSSTSMTWSWASIALNDYYAVSYTSVMATGLSQHPDFRLLKVHHSASTESRFNWVDITGLEVQGRLFQCQIGFKNTLQRWQKSVRFSLDRDVNFSFEETLYCFPVGDEAFCATGDPAIYAIVLREVVAGASVGVSNTCYQRVGLLKVAASKQWFAGGVGRLGRIFMV